ncbi:Sialoadhesin [Dissostichus eleginoides]|uniref:Sialoadhesin n=1 Tax=Dissostichus eleginoides TaxID=100907 RepID=A0AAD9F240_DISEL|nr:Sialoadhesin [Dissostichus eleginoides]
MEATALCITLWMTVFLQLWEQKVEDSGDYWCEAGGKKSNYVNVIITAGSVILESPVLPVMEGESVTLSCRHKTKTSSILSADFYKDGRLIRSSSTSTDLNICSVSKSDEGLYKCSIPDGGESPESRLAVRAGSVILESPLLPVMEGESVTLSCRNKISILSADFYKDGRLISSSSTGNITIHKVSKSDEGLYKCSIPDGGESPEAWLAVRAGSVILESPLLPVMEGESVTLSCRNKISILSADFYKDGRLIRSSSTGNITIHKVSKSDEGLYKCSISEGGESPEAWLAVRAVHRETCPSSDHSLYVLLVLRTVFTVVMVALLLLLVGLLHCGKLRVTQK